jgi:hypothetical protein
MPPSRFLDNVTLGEHMIHHRLPAFRRSSFPEDNHSFHEKLFFRQERLYF